MLPKLRGANTTALRPSPSTPFSVISPMPCTAKPGSRLFSAAVPQGTIRAANGTLFRAQTEDPDGDMRSAIDEAVSFIDRRIRKNKTRLAKNLRPDALVSTVPAEFDVVEDNDFDIIRTKRFSVKPMTTDEAVLQMNLLGHSFYVFRNIETNAVCVVYHRNNGGYGLIETEE